MSLSYHDLDWQKATIVMYKFTLETMATGGGVNDEVQHRRTDDGKADQHMCHHH